MMIMLLTMMSTMAMVITLRVASLLNSGEMGW